jgi:hypothetical protein
MFYSLWVFFLFLWCICELFLMMLNWLGNAVLVGFCTAELYRFDW